MSFKQICIVLSIVCSGILLLIISQQIWPNNKSVGDFISIAGSFASLGGVILAFFQIMQTKKQVNDVANVAEATKRAVIENRNDIRNFLSFSNMAHLIETMKNTQHHILTQDYRAAVIMMQDVKDNMLRTNDEFAEFIEREDINLLKHITTLSIDIDSLVHHITTENSAKKSTLKPNDVHRNLEEARADIIKIETALRKQKL